MTQPYHFEQQPMHVEGGIPLYLDGFSFSGIVNFHAMGAQWPQTAGILKSKRPENKVLNAMVKQSAERPVGDEEDGVIRISRINKIYESLQVEEKMNKRIFKPPSEEDDGDRIDRE